MQARLRVLADLTDLATLTVRVQEVQAYRPETAASFGLRLTRSVQQSFGSLIGAIQAVVLALAFALPWIVVILVPVSIALAVARRWRGRTLRAQVSAVQ